MQWNPKKQHPSPSLSWSIAPDFALNSQDA